MKCKQCGIKKHYSEDLGYYCFNCDIPDFMKITWKNFEAVELKDVIKRYADIKGECDSMITIKSIETILQKYEQEVICCNVDEIRNSLFIKFKYRFKKYQFISRFKRNNCIKEIKNLLPASIVFIYSEPAKGGIEYARIR